MITFPQFKHLEFGYVGIKIISPNLGVVKNNICVLHYSRIHSFIHLTNVDPYVMNFCRERAPWQVMLKLMTQSSILVQANIHMYLFFKITTYLWTIGTVEVCTYWCIIVLLYCIDWRDWLIGKTFFRAEPYNLILSRRICFEWKFVPNSRANSPFPRLVTGQFWHATHPYRLILTVLLFLKTPRFLTFLSAVDCDVKVTCLVEKDCSSKLSIWNKHDPCLWAFTPVTSFFLPIYLLRKQQTNKFFRK